MYMYKILYSVKCGSVHVHVVTTVHSIVYAVNCDLQALAFSEDETGQ